MSTPRNSRPSSLRLNWPTTQDSPDDDASIYILFHGLMLFAYNSTTDLCEIGVHAKAPEHEFKIAVYELEDGSIIEPPVYFFEPESHDDVPDGKVTVDISPPTKPGIHFHFPDIPNDFTWEQLLDLEGNDFYDRKLGKKPNTLKPRITINHGLFFVLPTDKLFEKVEDLSGDADEIGRIGFMGASTVKHEGSGTIQIKTKREEINLRASVAKPLLVVFFNACPQDECTSPDSDFPEYYKAFRLRLGERRFHLRAIEHSEQKSALGKLSFLPPLFEREPLRDMVSNNDTPCGIAGYGRSNGVDDSSL